MVRVFVYQIESLDPYELGQRIQEYTNELLKADYHFIGYALYNGYLYITMALNS